MKDMTVIRSALLACAALVAMTACTPTIKVQAPTEPITINLNVKIDQQVYIKLDREVEDLIANNPDIF